MVGVAADSELRALLVALVFHQFFEGISLGARLSESNLSGVGKLALAALFAVAAPVGIGAGLGIMSAGSVNTNGESFLLAQGVLDAVSAGFLLHIGFCMLLKDFPADLARITKDDKNPGAKRAGLFLALWTGAGLMAFLGKYL